MTEHTRTVTSVLFVCLGNICRSPLAEGILLREIAGRGLSIAVDSAGTGDWHVGHRADPRSIDEGERRGCPMAMRARQIRPEDFETFDLIVAMDLANERDLRRMAGPRHAEKVRLMRSFDPTAPPAAEVPDPYYGDEGDFREVGEMLERAVEGLLKEISEDGSPWSEARA